MTVDGGLMMVFGAQYWMGPVIVYFLGNLPADTLLAGLWVDRVIGKAGN